MLFCHATMTRITLIALSLVKRAMILITQLSLTMYVERSPIIFGTLKHQITLMESFPSAQVIIIMYILSFLSRVDNC